MPLSRYAVLGCPVGHSLSPRIHAAFARQSGREIDYRALDTGALGLEGTLAGFVAEGGIGANVTVPHKFAAARLCRTLSWRARRTGVVNTLALRDGHWHGESTDGIGLLRDLRERRGIDLYGSRILLIGAGGAAHGVAPSLLDAGIDQLVIANRTRIHAYDLLDLLQEPERTRACTLEELSGMGQFDLVVQATSAGHAGDAPELPEGIVSVDSACIDLNYGRAAIPFLAWARGLGCRQVHDGLGMLVEQAAEAYALWHGSHPATDPVYTQLRLASSRPQ